MTTDLSLILGVCLLIMTVMHAMLLVRHRMAKRYIKRLRLERKEHLQRQWVEATDPRQRYHER